MRDVKMAGLESLKIAAAVAVSFVALWGAAVLLQGIILAPVRAEAQEAARADSIRTDGLLQIQQATNETLGQLVVLIASKDEKIREETLDMIRAKYIIGATR